MKSGIVVLILVSVALAGGWIMERRAGSRARQAEVESIRYSNQWQEACTELASAKETADVMEHDLTRHVGLLTAASNQATQVSAQLDRTAAELTTAQASLRTAQGELEKRAAQITELESRKDELSRHMDEVSRGITERDRQIKDVNSQLATAVTNRDFLARELARLQDEKAALQSRFNNLAALRDQIAKLREESALSTRLAWQRKGLYLRRDMKGAEHLVTASSEVEAAAQRVQFELERNPGQPVAPNQP
jgi:chromosome segregation ATPase